MLKNIATIFVALAMLGIADFAAAQNSKSPTYVGSKACAACHGDQAAKWSRSHHAWAWQSPSDHSVLGDFNNIVFEHNGVKSKFFRRDGKYYIETDGPDGTPTIYELKGTVGVSPLQQYIVETEPGRLQALDVVWDVERRSWYHLYPDLDLRAGNGLHWTGPYKNWNSHCAECHATGFNKNYNPRTRNYASKFAETGVGCEACHGPGEAHIEWAVSPDQFDLANRSRLTDRGLTTKFIKTDSRAEIEQCAQCHSRRELIRSSNPSLDNFFDDHYRLALLRDGLYHADGQILDEVYVHGSFLQSKMYEKGVRCSNCHDPHSGQLRARGNGVCTQCHSLAGSPNFSTLRKAEYDSPKHHFHEQGTTGAKCISCHMPQRFYMIIDGRRDHSFRVPRPDLSARLGTPNTCTDCHRDKSAEWAAKQIRRHFPNSRLGLPHYSEVIAAGRTRRDAKTVNSLIGLAIDAKMPGIVRATALDLLLPMNLASVADQSAAHLSDAIPIVRSAAATLQRAASISQRIQRLSPLLTDKKTVVRIAAAKALLGIRGVKLTPAITTAFRSALSEYLASLNAKADFPEAQMAIGGTALVLRNFRAAALAFREATILDPQAVRAWLNIAQLYIASRNLPEAESVLRQAIEANPKVGELHLALSEILIAARKSADAISVLEEASQLLPKDDRAIIALGILQSRLGNHENAAATLSKLNNPIRIPAVALYQLVVSNLALGRRKQAELAVTKLDTLFSRSPLRERAHKLLKR